MNRDLIICLLDPEHHDRNAFDCGEPALNEYLQKTASQHLKKGIANTYILINSAESDRILGFFTLKDNPFSLMIPQQTILGLFPAKKPDI
jgi:ribonuclease BN (tRNA processing enzyme)